MPLAVGQTLTHYQVLAPLGAGGMGEVYHARDTRLEREVAIKVLPEELAQDGGRLRRFEREAKALARRRGALATRSRGGSAGARAPPASRCAREDPPDAAET